MADPDTSEQDTLLEEKLKHRLMSISMPENTVRANAARLAYEAGWKAAAEVAAEVAANGPRTHPADRQPRISEERLEMLRNEVPKTGVGCLSSTEYNVEDTCRWYARMGYGERVDFAARAGWHDFLKNNPEQTSPEMMIELDRARGPRQQASGRQDCMPPGRRETSKKQTVTPESDQQGRSGDRRGAAPVQLDFTEAAAYDLHGWKDGRANAGGLQLLSQVMGAVRPRCTPAPTHPPMEPNGRR